MDAEIKEMSASKISEVVYGLVGILSSAEIRKAEMRRLWSLWSRSRMTAREIADGFLADSAAANKRRAAIKQGEREAKQEGCTHENWDGLRYWCLDCGVTARELMEQGK